MGYQIKDNIISKNYQDYIEETFTEDFPWYHQLQEQEDWEEDWRSSNFIHMIHVENEDWQPPLQKTQRYKDIVYPILLEALDSPLKQVHRIRAVMSINGQVSEKGFPPHIDLSHPHLTMLYYVNDADGPTKIYDRDKVVAEVEPKKGRVLFMTGDTLHAGSRTTSTRRILLNFNFSLWN
jgi:hypothetical protein|tara:strand:+ start:254 stop:790 length:537 start_codon:yes stop_codon:yes gene_type:complete